MRKKNKLLLGCTTSVVLLFLTYMAWVWYCFTTSPDSFFGLTGSYDEMGEGYVEIDFQIFSKDERDCLTLLVTDELKNYAYDDNYIIVWQVPNFHRAENWFMYKTEYEKDSLQVLKKKCLEIGDCYWIISKRLHQLYGPMDKESFDLTCRIMGITLQMNPKYERKVFPQSDN